jgi:thiol-disulfide isomerase/thioredoxin
MKKISFVILLAVVIVSCSKEKELPANPDSVIINGKVLSGNEKQVKFDAIKQNPISDLSEAFFAEIADDSTFTLEIPLERLATGKIHCGPYYHDICLLPNDNFNIEIDGDTIIYEGRGAAKNNFLYLLEKENLSRSTFFETFNTAEILLDDFLTNNKEIKRKRDEIIKSYADTTNISKEFIDYFNIETREVSENLISEYPDIYSYMNNIHPDSLDLSDEYIRLSSLKHYADDAKIFGPYYLRNVLTTSYHKLRNLRDRDTSLTYNDAFDIIFFDSLPAKTGTYVFTKYILDQFANDKYDTNKIEKFNSMEKDEFAQKTFDIALAKFNEKQALIGKPIHEEFAKTRLQDTSGTELLFGDLMNQMKGKVVYLDCWSMGCGPCRAAMPAAKTLKEKLKDLPIEFVYFSLDEPRPGYWEKAFEATYTKKNHYSMINKYDSRLYTFMEINWVPNYMIFDKEGNLVTYNADRPVYADSDVESRLEKTLRELADK